MAIDVLSSVNVPLVSSWARAVVVAEKRVARPSPSTVKSTVVVRIVP
jgi:hypothetical protein